MIPIPIGTSKSAIVTGRVEKFVQCESCHGEFVYVARRLGTGSVDNLLDLRSERSVDARAAALAEQSLLNNFRTPDFVACPECGWYQSHMVRHRKKRRALEVLALGGACLAVVAFTVGLILELSNSAHLMLAAALTGAFLLTILFWYLIYDPNSGVLEEERQQRIATSTGIPLKQYLAQQVNATAEALRETDTDAGDADNLAWLANLTRSPEQVHSRQLNVFRRRQAEEAQFINRVFAIGSFLAIAVGATVGMIIDHTFLGAPQPELHERVSLIFILTIMFGGFSYFGVTRFQQWCQSVKNAINADLPTKYAPPTARAEYVAVAVAIVVAIVMATFAAVGHAKHAMHAYVCVLGCQVLALLGVWLARMGCLVYTNKPPLTRTRDER